MSSLQDDSFVSRIEEVCSCPAPRCADCGLKINLKEQAVEKIFPDLKALKQCLQDTLQPFSLDEVRRNCQFVCKSYSCRLGAAVEAKLESFEDRNAVIDTLCDEVGLEDVMPLIWLLGLFREGSEAILKCKEALKCHKMEVDKKELSKCVECTSPGISTPFTCFSRPSFLPFNFICQTTSQNSPPSSQPPTSPISSPVNLLPSAFLQYMGVEVQPVPETSQ